MSTKTITITEEAYWKLREHKREDESFTETIIRLTGGDRNLMKRIGTMADVEGFRKAVGNTRYDLDDDFRGRADR